MPIQRLVASLRGHQPALDSLAQELRTPATLDAFDKWNHNSWCVSVAGDALIRLRQFSEQNFRVVETMGLVSVARYTFELALWLRLFALDRRYGLVYFDQLLATQQRFYRDTLAQLKREVAWLRSLGEKEAASIGEVLERPGSNREDVNPGDVLEALSGVSESIDAEAARRFSIYADGAQVNGYGYQAHLVETQAIPPVEKALDSIAAERQEFDAKVSRRVKSMCPRRWQWRQMANKVGRADEYDYLYSFASKLLHATPASITTDQKNLEEPEMELFLKYIDVTVRDVLHLANEYRT